MDALRKAEQQKQFAPPAAPDGAAHRANPADAPNGLALEPLPQRELSAGMAKAAPTDNGLPELPGSLAALDEQFLAHAAPIARASPAANSPTAAPLAADSRREAAGVAAARSTARTVFAAKQPASLGDSTRGRHFAWGVAGLTLLGLLAIGVYFWRQLQAPTALLVPASATAPIALPPPAAAPEQSAPPPQTVPPPQAAAPPSLAADAPAATAAVSPAPTFASMQRVPSGADAERAAPAASPSSPVRRSPSTQPPANPPPAAHAALAAPPAAALPAAVALPIQRGKRDDNAALLAQQAHAAYLRGDPETAESGWHRLLLHDARNRDALHGLALLAQVRQQWPAAVGYYVRALEADPKDDFALAGLLALRQPGDPLQAESRLKTLLAGQPESPYLHFALGNQWARQQRWADAQQAYFNAYTLEPDNPDYLFNLAVSLDRLHQTSLALRYYREALQAAERQPGRSGFSRESATARLAELQATLAP